MTGRDETEFERVDRNLHGFLGELRVALPGVEVCSRVGWYVVPLRRMNR